MKIFSGSSNKPLAEKIAKHLSLPLSPVEIHIFPDGERRIRIEENVVDSETVVVQSTNPPVDENYMELFFIVDALKRSGASVVTSVIPYVGYQRQDHVFREGESRSLEVVARILEHVGVDKVIGIEFHSVKIPEIFRVPVAPLSALGLFAQKIMSLDLEKTVLVSPDMGGIRRIKQLSEMLNNMPFAAVEKNRDLATGRIESHEIQGDILPIAIIVDDMISSGRTISEAARLLQKKGAERIFVFATHPVFSEDAALILEEAPVEKYYVCDTIDILHNKRFSKLEIISVAELIAQNLSS